MVRGDGEFPGSVMVLLGLGLRNTVWSEMKPSTGSHM